MASGTHHKSISQKPPEHRESRVEKPPSLLSSARDLVFVLGILAFFTGFEYRFYYYHYLGIPASIFSFADTQMVAGSYSVFSSHFWYVLVIVVIMVGFGSDFGVSVFGPSVKYWRLALLALLPVTFPILSYWAQETAGQVYTQLVDRKTVAPDKPIIVSLVGPSHNLPLESSIQKGCVELITQSSDSLYVLVRDMTYPHFYVAAIPTRSIERWFTPLDYPGGSYAKQCAS